MVETGGLLGLTGQPAYLKHTKTQIQRETLCEGDKVKGDRGRQLAPCSDSCVYEQRHRRVHMCAHVCTHTVINQKRKRRGEEQEKEEEEKRKMIIP